MPAIGVISVNYHSQQKLNRCLTSLKASCRGDLRYIVVDNSPTSEMPAISSAHPDVQAIVPGRNLGFAGGCNRGIRLALSQGLDYVLLLNPDTWTEHDFLTPLLTALETNERWALAGPTIVRDTVKRQLWYGGATMNWWQGGPRQITSPHHKRTATAHAVPCLSGCAMLIKTSAIREVGLLDERYFLYFEDSDYVQRFRQAGLEAIYVPAATLIHDVSSTVGFQSRDYVYYFSRNRVWFMRRWARWPHFLGFMLYNTLIKLPGAVLIFGLLRRQPALAYAYFLGYWHGIGAGGR